MTELLLGLLVGLVLALTGAGGSIVAVPLLMFGLDWTLTQAAPVALLAVLCSAAVGTAMGLRARIVRYRAAALMSAFGIAMTPLGLYAAQRLPLVPLTLAFAVLLVVVAVRMFRQAGAQLSGSSAGEDGRASTPCLIDPQTGRLHWTGRCGRALSLVGIVTGLMTGLFGVGGGFLIVPTLRRVTDLSMRSIAATSMMTIMLVSSGAVVSAALAQRLALDAALPFAAGAVLGMIGGQFIAARFSGPRLQQGFALLTVGAALTLVVRTLSI